MSMDGFEWDLPATKKNIAAFGFPGTGKNEAPAAFPTARVVTIGECASHAGVAAAIGPVASKGSGEQALARSLYPILSEDWLLIADRNFYNGDGWCAAADTGAALLWRVKSDLRLPVLIALITTITDPRQAPAGVLAQAYHERWEHETGNAQLKMYLRGPGKVLRSQSPDMVRQEIYGYLLNPATMAPATTARPPSGSSTLS